MATATQKQPNANATPESAPTDNWLADLWDKTTDGLTSFTEKISNGLVRLFGASNERAVRRMRVIVDQINSLETGLMALSDEELRAKTDEFRDRLEKGATLDDILPEAFAVCREGGRRFLNMRHYDVQLMGGMVLHGGNIAEMVTGEGKTLVATLPTYLNALEGKGVHVITVNDYLARRDAEWMSPLYNGLGLSVGAIQSDMDSDERQDMYHRDITYGTNNEFGFDYLRDNMKPERSLQVQGPLNFAVIDEVDSILVDEARTPLIISGPATDDVTKYSDADRVARQLRPIEHFEIKEKERSCHLNETGVREAERLAGVESFYTPGNMEWPHLIDNALKAHHLYKRDREYMVTDKGEVIIIDEFTGRLMVGRQWSDGLHQAVEAKERVKIKEENQTLATITLQNYFKLYKKISGMTGTAMTEANEFWKVYKLDVIAIPTNKSLRRVNYPDRIYKTEREKLKAIINEIREVHAAGRPILVGTTSVAKSEELAHYLEMHGIPHAVLNAKYHEKESEIVAQAGGSSRVTIATNMAGRGTDIILGGNPEFMAWADLKFEKDEDGRVKYPTRLEVPPQVWRAAVSKYEETMKGEGRQVAAAGGLHIIGTERHEARRIDNQLRGRAGRQGDPGSSRFFLSLEDDLMRKFIGDFAAKMIAWSGLPDDEPIESKMVSRRIEGAQKKIEERNFDIRKNLLEYDEVMDQQRKKVYSFRQRILDGWPPKTQIMTMIESQVRVAAANFLANDYGAASFADWVGQRLGVELSARDYLRVETFEDAVDIARAKAEEQAADQIREAMEENLPPDEERSEWNWINLANWSNNRYGSTIRDRDLKAFLSANSGDIDEVGFDREALADFLLSKAKAAIEETDLSPAKPFLSGDWGRQTLADWVRAKFGLTLDPAAWEKASLAQVVERISEEARQLYVRKEAAFPARVGLTRFISDRTGGQGPRYDREGLAVWTQERFGVPLDLEQIKHLNRQEIEAILLDISTQRNRGDALSRELDSLLDAAYGPAPSLVDDAAETTASDKGRAKRVAPPDRKGLTALADWAARELGLEAKVEDLAEMTRSQLANEVTRQIDAKFRPEMREMEKMVVLQILDNGWMEHLRTMDHLRSSVGLRGYAQVDPKSEYKREGVKLFEQMWTNVSERVTELVFRMEEFDPNFLAYLAQKQMSRVKMVHDSPPAADSDEYAGEDGGTATASDDQGDVKREPLRNTGKRVGRNDPCPCGSGKKFKSCCMRRQAGAAD